MATRDDRRQSKRLLGGEKPPNKVVAKYLQVVSTLKKGKPGEFVAKSLTGIAKGFLGSVGLSETYDRLERYVIGQMKAWDWVPEDKFPVIMVRILVEAKMFEEQLLRDDYYKHLFIRYQRTPETKKAAFLDNIASTYADMRDAFAVLSKWRHELDALSGKEDQERYEKRNEENKKASELERKRIEDEAIQAVNFVRNEKSDVELFKYLEKEKNSRYNTSRVPRPANLVRGAIIARINDLAKKEIADRKKADDDLLKARESSNFDAKQKQITKRHDFLEKIPHAIDEINAAWTQISNLNNHLLIDMLPYPEIADSDFDALADFVQKIRNPQASPDEEEEENAETDDDSDNDSDM